MIIVTGGSRGLGRQLVEKYRVSGQKVYSTYQSTLTSEMEKKIFHQVDVKNFESVNTWVGQLDITANDKITLINCAGISYNSFCHKSEPEKWAEVIEVNLVGTYNCIRAFLPFMRTNNFGRIVTISSVVAQMGGVGVTAYSASKAGLWGLTKSLSKECKGKDITINNINLGYFEAGMIQQVPEEVKQDIRQRTSSNRFGQPDELYNLIEYIRSAQYTNGSSFDINGGLY